MTYNTTMFKHIAILQPSKADVERLEGRGFSSTYRAIASFNSSFSILIQRTRVEFCCSPHSGSNHNAHEETYQAIVNLRATWEKPGDHYSEFDETPADTQLLYLTCATRSCLKASGRADQRGLEASEKVSRASH